MEEKKRELRRWVLSSIDLEQAHRWVNYILENNLYLEDDDTARTVGRGLQTAMIVAYCRPFSGNFERDHTVGKLSDEFLETYTEQEHNYHSRILDLRNQIFAHTDSEHRDLSITIHGFAGQSMAWPSTHNPYPVMEKDELQQLRKMLKKLRGAVAGKTIELQKELTPGEEF